jgi:hypothetical protein
VDKINEVPVLLELVVHWRKQAIHKFIHKHRTLIVTYAWLKNETKEKDSKNESRKCHFTLVGGKKRAWALKICGGRAFRLTEGQG